jgi:protein TonB
VPGATPATAPPSWLGAISSALARHRTYPARLRAERIAGVVLLRFTVDRSGNVLARRVERSSGQPALDELALDLLARAAPLPPPPGDLPGPSIELVVPVRYALR